MTQAQMFHQATWVGSEDYRDHRLFILRGKFTVNNVKQATIRVLGMGIFHCYLNGVRISDDLFLPLDSEYEPRENFPVNEKLSGFHTYVPEYDVTSLLKNGENQIAIHFGGGRYTFERECRFGYPKAIWRIFGTDENGTFEAVSSVKDKIASSFIYEFEIPDEVDSPVERQDLNHENTRALAFDFDDSSWKNAVPASAPDTDYRFSDCPADRVCQTITPCEIFSDSDKKVYDVKKNLVGIPVLVTRGKKGEVVTLHFAEERLDSGELDPKFCHKQEFSCICDGTERTVRPLFSWYGFRYLEISSNARLVSVEEIHTDLAVTSHFESDQDTLNWLYRAYVNTELSNLHTGIPSDCPHIERRGYTGDGQLTCHAAMTVLDAKELYRKWMQDIADGQDSISGHVQNTAPYTHSGGGPGGFSGAIVEVPYQFYRHYGDRSVLEQYYPNMLRYFDYLEAHSEADLVVSDKPGEWCLGEWCPPEGIILPLPFVNTYFFVKYLSRAVTIAGLIGKQEDIPALEEKIQRKKNALLRSYFNYNYEDSNFFGCRQAGNAFMLDIGLGNKKTYPNMVKYYEKLGGYDTGIFGTELLTRTLFERGNGDLAVKLLTSENLHSYAEMKKRGATTVWEYFPGSMRDRSHNHPMFGAVCACLFDYILGIREADGSVRQDKIKIQPMAVNSVKRASGYRTLEAGKVCVSYENKDGCVRFELEIPEGLDAEFVYLDHRYPLQPGKNTFCL